MQLIDYLDKRESSCTPNRIPLNENSDVVVMLNGVSLRGKLESCSVSHEHIPVYLAPNRIYPDHVMRGEQIMTITIKGASVHAID